MTKEQTEIARTEWANSLIDECVSIGLQVIALTDHHEMVMVSYVQKVVEERRQSDAHFDFWCFPGMELTTRGGKQCLIIFDADLSESCREAAQSRLGISRIGLKEKTAKAPQVTQLHCAYPDIAGLLDDLDDVRGRYIVLPNVSQGNNHTVLTDGGHGDFSRMSYVGGYLDRGQNLSTLSRKNQVRISGTDQTWSQREIYPLPTSDSREADFSFLGRNDAWIKLAEPTAEAIRQAFLGHHSRIKAERPTIPSLVIAMAEIEGSAILHSTAKNVNPEFNAVIGGRGTGKSTFLEYLAFGLGRSCYDAPRDEYSGNERMRDLINETLVTQSGKVSLKIVQDNAVFSVIRGPNTAYQPQIVYPNGSTQTIDVAELRRLFPAVVYSQGELAEIGKQTGRRTKLVDLMQFVKPDYKRLNDQLAEDIEAAKLKVRSAIQSVASAWELQSRVRKLTTNRDSLKQRVEALEKTLPELAPEDQKTVDYFKEANDFDTQRLQATKHADRIVQELDSIANELFGERELSSTLTDQIVEMQHQYRDFYSTFETGLKALISELRTRRTALALEEEKWAARLLVARRSRDTVLQKLQAHQTATTQIIALREELTNTTNELGDLESRIKGQGDATTTLSNAIDELRRVALARDTQTHDWANEIERLSSGKIKAIVASSSDITEIKDAIDNIASKTGSQEASRTRKLSEALADHTAEEIIDRMRTECLGVLYWRYLGAADGRDRPACPDLSDIVGSSERIQDTLFNLMDTTRVEAIATAVPQPIISLSYCDGSREISFEKASDGQRAAALLFMLLEQSGGPLIVDQPEGDLDNRIIAELANNLHKAKQNRQLVFASHNANIVVNGSAESVCYLDTCENGERAITLDGAIDELQIRDVITSTMEGGEKAFKDRQDKYGY